MDAPSAVSALYDPEDDDAADATGFAIGFAQVVGQVPVAPEPRPVQPGTTLPPSGLEMSAPKGVISAEALEELGILVIRANNPQDMELTLQLIETIRRIVQDKAEPTLRLVTLKFGDANSISTTLNQIFARVLVGLAGNSVNPAARGPQSGVLSALGVPSNSQNVYLIPLPRFNQILVAAPKGRIDDVQKEIEKFDRLNGEQTRPKAFPLVRASAQIVAQQLQQFWNQRVPRRVAQRHPVPGDVRHRRATPCCAGQPGGPQGRRGLHRRHRRRQPAGGERGADLLPEERAGG